MRSVGFRSHRVCSLPVAYRLYVPQEWLADHARRTRVGIPEKVVFQTKPEIALEQLRTLWPTATTASFVEWYAT